MATDGVSQAIICLKKSKWFDEDEITIAFLKEGEKFGKMTSILFSKCPEKSCVLEDWNNTVMVLLYKQVEKENIKNYCPIRCLVGDL